MVRLVTPVAHSDAPPHLSPELVRAKVEAALAKNPTAILIMLEVGDEVQMVSAPDSWTMRRGMILTAHEFMTAPEE